MISLSISKSKNISELQIAISELKVRINAYGIAYNSIFADSHIWEQIFIVESMESLSLNELNNIKRKFVNQISCLLKYDWERAKVEIKGNMQTRVVIVTPILSFLLYSFRWFYNYNVGSGKIMNFLSYTVIFILFSAFAILMISFADKWKNTVQFYMFILGSVLGLVFFYVFMYVSLPSALPFDITDWIIRLAPFITLLYSLEIKLLAYRRNVNHFILASALSCGTTKIHKKYKIFFSRKEYDNFLTGEESGVGKTELAIRFANRYSSNVFFVTFSKNIKETIAKLRFVGSEQNADTSIQYHTNIELLRMFDSNTVLIIDNFDLENNLDPDILRNEKEFIEIINLDLKIIITTRNNYGVGINVKHLNEEELLSLMFRFYCHKEKSEILKEIIKEVQYNTLVVELCVRTFNTLGSISPEQLLANLQNLSIDGKGYKGIYSEKDRTQFGSYLRRNLVDHIRHLYQLSCLTFEER